MSIIDQIARHEQAARRTRGRTSLHPAWSGKQRYNYPVYEKRAELIRAFIAVEEEYLRRVDDLKLGLGHPEISKNAQEIKRYEDKISEAKATLDRAQIELSRFNNHSPEERIALYEDEINQLTPLLEEARQRQVNYTQELLNDPHAAQRRLDRQLNGGDGAEYSPQQLAELRSFKDNVRTIEAKISQCEQDIETIHSLVAKAEKEAEIKSAMEEAMPRFELACSEFRKAWAEIRNIARENGIYFDEEQPRLPTGVRFKQSRSQNEGQSVIRLDWE